MDEKIADKETIGNNEVRKEVKKERGKWRNKPSSTPRNVEEAHS